ncbi:MAG: SdpI family protein [Erysipelotrichaceae bacterium]
MNVYDFDLLLPIGLFIIAALFYAFPPGKINSWAGYRTKRSMESQKNWDYANKYAGLIMMVSMLFMTLVILVSRRMQWADRDTVLLTNTLICLPVIFLPIPLIERKLKKGIK